MIDFLTSRKQHFSSMNDENQFTNKKNVDIKFSEHDAFPE
jgi:macrodomain Ter protein organizer (MatP/YcbG family)